MVDFLRVDIPDEGIGHADLLRELIFESKRFLNTLQDIEVNDFITVPEWVANNDGAKDYYRYIYAVVRHSKLSELSAASRTFFIHFIMENK